MTLRETLLMMPVLLSLPTAALADTVGESAPMTQDGTTGGVPLSPGGTLAEILNHPAFAGFATRILPWDDRAPDPALPLTGIGSLLPYHSAVDTGTVVAGLNRMIRDAAAGQAVFYDFHPAPLRTADPAIAKTGLFFYRGKPGAPFAVIAPGGGFAYVGSLDVAPST